MHFTVVYFNIAVYNICIYFLLIAHCHQDHVQMPIQVLSLFSRFSDENDFGVAISRVAGATPCNLHHTTTSCPMYRPHCAGTTSCVQYCTTVADLFMPSPPFFRHKSRKYSVILLFTCVGHLSVMNLIHYRYRKTRPSRVVIPTLSCPNSNDRRLNRPKSCDEHVRNKVRCKNYNRPRRIVRFVNKPTTAADCI